MEHVEYRHTFGMTDAELDELLRTNDVGILALADGNDAYAIPVSYDYDGESVVVRLAEYEDSTKRVYAESTETATFVVYDDDPSWSIIVRGSLRERDDYDDTRINERFSTLRIFDEPIDELEANVYELEAETVTGRRVDQNGR